jgi:hypothetical protein
VTRSRPRTLRSERWGGGEETPKSRSKLVWLSVPLVVVAFVAGLLLGKPVAEITGSPDPVAEMKKEEARRDAAQIESLTAQARRMSEGLVPVLTGLAGTAATTQQVADWQKVTKGYVDEFAERPSAGTAVNIARSGLATSVQQLDLAVSTYAQGLAAAEKESWLGNAKRQRELGIVTWSIAATQLDVLNIDAGRGHVHVFLPSEPGQGALTSDGTPEGHN